MIYGELDAFPLDIKTKTRMLRFWASLVTKDGYSFKWLQV